jgi:hypothetical protein
MKKIKIAVISANLGGIDSNVSIRHPKQKLSVNHELQFFYLDDINFPKRHTTMQPRLQAKIPKMLGYEIFPNFDYYIWLDGNFSLADETSILSFIESCKNYDACFFHHPKRNTIKDEFDFVLDNLNSSRYLESRYQNEYIEEQKELYSQIENFWEQPVYALGAFVYSKELIAKQEFNIFQQWFYHNCRYSVQDQLSFSYLLLKNKDVYNIGLLEGNIIKINKYVVYHKGHK